MNLFKKTLSVFLLAALPYMASAKEGKVTVRVIDFDTGVVVTNAEVRASFNTTIKPGWGWGGGRPNRETGRTDTNGICTLTGSGNGGSVGISAFKEGYYGSAGYNVDFTNVTGVVNRKWQPWNSTVDVTLKRIGKPIPLYAKCIRNMEMPVVNTSIGFDLVAGDWVSPHGDGKESDIIFQMNCPPERVAERVTPHGTYNITLYDVTLIIRGANDGDGFYFVPLTPIGHGPSSGLRMPREAPIEGYETSIVKRVYNSVDEPMHTDVQDDANYFFRVRTEKDQDGNIVSALHGKTHGDFQINHKGELTFTYYLNPMPNDRNVEFDPIKNLFKNLSSQEEVREP